MQLMLKAKATWPEPNTSLHSVKQPNSHCTMLHRALHKCTNWHNINWHRWEDWRATEGQGWAFSTWRNIVSTEYLYTQHCEYKYLHSILICEARLYDCITCLQSYASVCREGELIDCLMHMDDPLAKSDYYTMMKRIRLMVSLPWQC